MIVVFPWSIGGHYNLRSSNSGRNWSPSRFSKTLLRLYVLTFMSKPLMFASLLDGKRRWKRSWVCHSPEETSRHGQRTYEGEIWFLQWFEWQGMLNPTTFLIIPVIVFLHYHHELCCPPQMGGVGSDPNYNPNRASSSSDITNLASDAFSFLGSTMNKVTDNVKSGEGWNFLKKGAR